MDLSFLLNSAKLAWESFISNAAAMDIALAIALFRPAPLLRSGRRAARRHRQDPAFSSLQTLFLYAAGPQPQTDTVPKLGGVLRDTTASQEEVVINEGSSFDMVSLLRVHMMLEVIVGDQDLPKQVLNSEAVNENAVEPPPDARCRRRRVSTGGETGLEHRGRTTLAQAPRLGRWRPPRKPPSLGPDPPSDFDFKAGDAHQGYPSASIPQTPGDTAAPSANRHSEFATVDLPRSTWV